MKLVEQRDRLREVVETYRDGLTEIDMYVRSPKFDIDNRVNVNDITLRINELKRLIDDISMGVM